MIFQNRVHGSRYYVAILLLIVVCILVYSRSRFRWNNGLELSSWQRFHGVKTDSLNQLQRQAEENENERGKIVNN